MSGRSNRWSWELPSSEPRDPAWFRPSTSHWPRQPGRPASTPPGNSRSGPPEGDFRRAVLYTVAGTALPGLGLIAAKRRIAGWIILGLFLAVLTTLAAWAALDLQGLVSLAVRPAVLRTLTVALILVALFWVTVVITSHLSLRTHATQAQRITGGILVGALSFAVAAPMAVASRYSYDQASLVTKVFGSEKDTKSATRPTLNPAGPSQAGQPQSQDPWANKPRLNILMLGGDAGPNRTGTRTDTVILASIDTRTGNTTLFSLPRNTGRMPFPADSALHTYYPKGFTSGNGNNAEYFLNAMYDNVPANVPKDVLGPTDDLGADALKLSVGQALGLPVDYYVMINLQGFTKLINALGGITLNINTYIPIGGNTDLGIPPIEYLKPGPDQHLNGRSALWYARGRYGSDDYARMDRQRCVINAIIKQANPTTMLTRYEDIAKAGKDIVRTDIPREVLPIMVDLSWRVKNGNVRSIVFKHGDDGFLSPNPDFGLMRRRVTVALGEAQSSPTPTPTKSTASKPKTESEDVNRSCAYNAKTAAEARPPR
ncbi:MAG TPA: LCP family protein [Propionibacteriaceae bacterium]|nr:LCP family protein [Propionibacteriaceae bacterium]